MKKTLLALTLVVAVGGAFASLHRTSQANLYKKVNGECELVQCSTSGVSTCTIETSTTLFTSDECPKTTPTAYSGTRYIPF
jgi:hypothetical protein